MIRLKLMKYSREDFDKVWMVLVAIHQEHRTNKKLQILKENADNSLLKKILQYTYDGVKYTYGVRETAIFKFEKGISKYALYNDLFDLLDDLNSRELTGDNARGCITQFYNANKGTTIAGTLLRILAQDQRLNMSVKSF